MSEQPEALRLADGMRPEAIRLADTLPRAMPSLESAVWGQRAAAELRRLYAENSALAAGQCTEGGPWGDEGGTPYCKLIEMNQELIDVINSIYIYANDTLSGRVDGPDDRDWQRAGVVEIRNRALRLATIETAVKARAALRKAKGETE